MAEKVCFIVSDITTIWQFLAMVFLQANQDQDF
jgi:hypothetical protein